LQLIIKFYYLAPLLLL